MTATAAGMSRTALIACWPYSLGAFAESPGVSPRSFRGLSASRSWRLKLYQHQDVELLGAGSGRERVQAFPESLLELVGTHCREATTRQRITSRVPLARDVHFRRSAHRLGRPGWQP